MLRVAITGGIACGKSLAGSYVSAEGIPVCDTDDVAHGLMGKGTSVYRELVQTFGKRIVGPEGQIDRDVLGTEVFSSAKKLAVLNSIVHPKVREAWEVWLHDQSTMHKAAAVIIPLLYEIGEKNENWDAVICVSAKEEEQKRRLKERNLSDSEIEARLSAQMPVSEKMRQADYVLFNNGTREILKEQTARVLRSMLEMQNDH